MGRKIFVFIFLVSLIPPALFTGGWNNTLMGSRALAIGAAFAGLADDPSAIYYNPAGLVFQKQKMNLQVAGFYIRPTHEFTTPAGSVAHSKYNVSFPQVFFTYKASDRISLGFGAYIPYAGGGVDWTTEELGFPFKSNLGIISLTPSLSYQVSENLSLGFNINIYRGVLEVNTQGGTFGPLKSDESGSALSAGLGLLFKPSEKISLGLNIRGPAKMKLTGKTAVPVVLPGLGQMDVKLKSETSFNLPWDVELGAAFRLSDRLLLSTSAQYTVWTTLDKVKKVIKGIPGTGDISADEILDFNNILIIRAGVEYIIPGGIFLRAGVGIDRSASPPRTLSITNIDVDKFTLIGGFGYRTGQVQLDFVFVQANGREREKQVSLFGIPLTEKYNLSATIFGMGVTFSF